MRRSTRISLVVVIVGVAVFAAAARGGPGYRVVFPHRIGAFALGGSYRKAVAVFGRPSDFRRRWGGICELSWDRLGLRMSFRTPEKSPCSRGGLAEAKWNEATILSRRWIVDRGVRVGDSWARVRRVYSLERLWRAGVLLSQRAIPLAHTQYIRYIELEAIFHDGRVSRFDLSYG
jgi:hypothetical protein